MSANYSGLRQRESNVKPIAEATTSNVQHDLESQSLSSGYDQEWTATATLGDTIQHRDALGRVSKVSNPSEPKYGWYLDPDDAKLRKLRKIQQSTSVKSKVPWAIRAAASAYHSDGGSGLKLRPASYVAAAFAIPFLLFTPTHLEARVRNGGRYDRVLYRDWFPVDVAKNKWEAESSRERLIQPGISKGHSYDGQAQQSTERTYEMRTLSPPRGETSSLLKTSNSDLQERLLGPSRLCFVDASITGNRDYVSMEVNDWLKQRHGRGYPRFLFLSYTSSHFVTQSEEALRNIGLSGSVLEDGVRKSATNRRALTSLAARVARERSLDAFWIDFDSGSERGQGSDKSDLNAYAICDFLRASTEMIIVVGPPHRYPMDRESVPASRNEWLASWGDRLWTLPELLICPNSHGIAIYTLDGQPPETLSKHTIARMLQDGNNIRELVEHYTGTIQLSPLELTVTATQCLFARPCNEHSAGDASYALMGLMRRRPRVNKQDSAFKAFARLSLLNDNDRLLERLICLQPDPHKPQPWYDLYDDYQSSLWDIEPCTQVAGIVDPEPAIDPRPKSLGIHTSKLEDTQIIVLDGAFGAHIRWKSLEPVAYLNRPSIMHVLVRGSIRALLFFLVVGLILTSLGAYFRSHPGFSDPNSRRSLASRDSATSTIDYANVYDLGKRQSFTVIHNPDGSETIRNADGSETTLYPSSTPTPSNTDNFSDTNDPTSTNSTTPSNDQYKLPKLPNVMSSVLMGMGLIIFLPSIIVTCLSPYILRRLYAGKLWATQAAFFGVSGIPDLAEVERCIFGFNQDRLKWSTHGSKLSIRSTAANGELISQKPIEPERSGSSPLQTYTLIDTFTLTATVFEAERVPVAAIICGQEGGMQRALLCSYDPVTRAFCKETVLRMKTLCLERMPRVDRFRFAMRRG